METTIVYWGYTEIMEKKMETSIMGCIGLRGLGFRFMAYSLGLKVEGLGFRILRYRV